MNPPRIELASDLDRTSIRSLLDHAESPFDVDAELSRSYAKLWVARRSGETLALGLLLAWEAGDSADLIDLIVAPEARRGGLARALLQTLVGYARTRALMRVILEVRAGNVGARRLYETSGFHQVGERHGYYSDGENALLYEFRMEP